ncbi:MAG: epoxyqueuosine reductase [Bacillota bacterium]
MIRHPGRENTVNREDIAQIISEFVEKDPGNLIPDGPRIFQDPIVGFAAADDPIFDDFRNPDIIALHHRTPREWLSTAKTVISYFLPIGPEIRRSNEDGEDASTEWIFARFWGEALNDRLRRVLVSRLQRAGYDAVAPLLHPDYRVIDLRSNWSERHVAFAANLGAFGLNRGLITRRGMAGRFGSVVTSLPLDAEPIGNKNPFRSCPQLETKDCGECIERCPVGALSIDGKDIELCRTYLREVKGPGVRDRYGFPYSPCGKCYVGVSCEASTPLTAIANAKDPDSIDFRSE